MIPTDIIPHRNGELRIGWASWDEGRYESRSIKFAYRDSSGKISRGSPELPFDVLVDMLDFARDKDELRHVLPAPVTKAVRNVAQLSIKDLQQEKKALSTALTRIQLLIADIPWANWQPIYDELGERFEDVKAEIADRTQ